MFSDEQHIEGKVFLKSYTDALLCLKLNILNIFISESA